jgi:hypothetical protein
MRTFLSLLKRRFAIQIREKNLLILELLFPIVYLGFGFYIASINLIKDGKSVLLSDPSIYPQPLSMQINSNAPMISGAGSLTP